MASLKDTFSTIGGWFGDFVSLGLSLAMVFLVVDALFGVGTTGIVDNVADLVGAFTDNGLTGLIAFVVLMSIWGIIYVSLWPVIVSSPPNGGGCTMLNHTDIA